MSDREYPPRPIVGIGTIVVRPGEVLLIRRGKAPGLGSWSLPGGAQELGETIEQAARRELEEETGLRVGPLKLAACFDSIRNDPSGRVHYHYTIIDYAALWEDGEPQAGGDAAVAQFVPFDDLERYKLTEAAHEVIGIARRLFSL